jgi:hypothetical protein
MNYSRIFRVIGFLLLFGFLGVLISTLLPGFSKEEATASLFMAVFFGNSGVGLIILSRLIRESE